MQDKVYILLDKFEYLFCPIMNPIGSGHEREFYPSGKDLEFVSSYIHKDRIWTYMTPDDSGIKIVSGIDLPRIAVPV
jgi:hypothetical protein